MPQMNNGSNFFGKVIDTKKLNTTPTTIGCHRVQYYAKGKVYLFTESNDTGSFCITWRGLLEPSILRHILTDAPTLQNHQPTEGEFVPYREISILTFKSKYIRMK